MPSTPNDALTSRQLRKGCQHPYLCEPELENMELSEEEQHKRLVDGSGKLLFLKQLLPRLKARGHRILLFSQVCAQCPSGGAGWRNLMLTLPSSR